MSKFQSHLLNFAEAVLAKESAAQEGKLAGVGPWYLDGQIDEDKTNILSAQEFGVIKARTAKRRPETLKWDRELYEAINVVSWLIDGPLQDRKLAGHQHPGCKACDGETSGVRHRGRPFNHSPECSTRQPDFRERLREMKMLSAHEASSVMEPAAGSSRLRRNGKPNGQRWFAWKSLRRRKTSTEIKPVDLC